MYSCCGNNKFISLYVCNQLTSLYFSYLLVYIYIAGMCILTHVCDIGKITEGQKNLSVLIELNRKLESNTNIYS